MRFRFFAVRFAASLRAFVSRVRTNTSSSLRHALNVLNSDFASTIFVALTDFSSTAHLAWNSWTSVARNKSRTCSLIP